MPARIATAVRPTYRRSAAGARGSEATDKPVCCNALLGRAAPPDAIVRVSCGVDDVQYATLSLAARWRGAMKQKRSHRKDIAGCSRTRDVALEWKIANLCGGENPVEVTAGHDAESACVTVSRVKMEAKGN